MRHLRPIAAAALLGAAAICGCSGGRDGNVLGADPGKAALTPVRDLKADEQVVVAGTMIEKCPTAGCWFMLKDGTGVVRVDTKAAGITVTDVPVNTAVTVTGKVKGGSERLVAATGIRY